MGGWKNLCHSPVYIVKCVSKYIYFISKNKQVKKQEYKKKKKKRKQRRKAKISRKLIIKKNVCGCPGENFSCHPHFWKQKGSFLALGSNELNGHAHPKIIEIAFSFLECVPACKKPVRSII